MQKLLFLSLFLMSVVCLTPTQIDSSSPSKLDDQMISDDTQKPDVYAALEDVPNHNKPFASNSQLQNSTDAANINRNNPSGSENADIPKAQTRKQSTAVDQNKKTKEDDGSPLQNLDKKKIKAEQSEPQSEKVKKDGKTSLENINPLHIQTSQSARTKGKREWKAEESKQEVNKKAEVSPNEVISPESGKTIQTSKQKIQKNIQAKKIMANPGHPEQKNEQKEGQQIKNRYSQEHFQDEKQKQKKSQNGSVSKASDDFVREEKENLAQEVSKVAQEVTKSTQEVIKSASQTIEDEETIVIKPASSKNFQKELNPPQKSDISGSKKEDSQEVQVVGLAEKKEAEGKVVSEGKRQTVAVAADQRQNLADARSELKVNPTRHSQIVSSQQKRDSVTKEAKDQFEENRQIQHKIKIIPLEDEPFTSKKHENKKQNQEGTLPASSHNSRGENVEQTLPPPQNSKKEEGDKTEKQPTKQNDQPHPSVPDPITSDKDQSPEQDKKIQKLIEEVKNTKGQLAQDSKKQIIKYLQAGKTIEKENEQQIQPQNTVLRMERTTRSDKQSSSSVSQTVAKDRDFINQQQMDTTTIVIIIILTFVISIPIFREIRRKEGDEPAKQEKQNLNNVKEGGEKTQPFPDFNEMSYQSGFQIGERIDEDFN